MDYITDKKTFLAMKNHQKNIAPSIKEGKNIHKEYQKEISKWLKEYYLKHPDHRVIHKWDYNILEDYKTYPKQPTKDYELRVSRINARAFNIIYGLVKGKKYQDIERNAKRLDSNTERILTNSINYYIKEFSISEEIIKDLLKETPMYQG